jgi:protein TonB
MDELRAIKKQSTAYLPGFHWVKSGVFPFFVSLCLHIGIAGGASLALYAAYDKSGGGSAQHSDPVFVTFVQEASERANIPDETEPVMVEKAQSETSPKTTAQKQDIITDIKQGTVPLPQENIKDLEAPDKNEQKKRDLEKNFARTDKAETSQPQTQNATVAQAQSWADTVQTVYHGGSGSAEVKYQDQVRAAIHANIIYPRQARRLKIEGEGIVRLEVMRDGHIKSYRFVKSTGHHLLDHAVEEIIKNSDPLPNVPSSINKVPVTLDLPLGFKLQK